MSFFVVWDPFNDHVPNYALTVAVVVACCGGRRVAFGFAFDFAGRFSGDKDTRPKVAGAVVVCCLAITGEDDALKAPLDTRSEPVKLFNVRSISSSLDLA